MNSSPLDIFAYHLPIFPSFSTRYTLYTPYPPVQFASARIIAGFTISALPARRQTRIESAAPLRISAVSCYDLNMRTQKLTTFREASIIYYHV